MHLPITHVMQEQQHLHLVSHRYASIYVPLYMLCVQCIRSHMHILTRSVSSLPTYVPKGCIDTNPYQRGFRWHGIQQFIKFFIIIILIQAYSIQYEMHSADPRFLTVPQFSHSGLDDVTMILTEVAQTQYTDEVHLGTSEIYSVGSLLCVRQQLVDLLVVILLQYD